MLLAGIQIVFSHWGSATFGDDMGAIVIFGNSECDKLEVNIL